VGGLNVNLPEKEDVGMLELELLQLYLIHFLMSGHSFDLNRHMAPLLQDIIIIYSAINPLPPN